MDNLTSIIAAFDAGKLPSTQQTIHFIDWLAQAVITKVEPSNSSLSPQGRTLAIDLLNILDAYKLLAQNKNDDNMLQEAIYHLSASDIATPASSAVDKDAALADINKLQSSLRVILSVVLASVTSEGSSLARDFISFARLALANAAELVEEQAGHAKARLREVERGVREGERDTLGRDKKRLEEEEKDVKIQFEHGMDRIKQVGVSAISVGQSTTSNVKETFDDATSRVEEALYKISDRAQSNSDFQSALSAIFSILQSRVSSITPSQTDFPYSAFLDDPTTEQHISKALYAIQSLLSRLSSQPVDSLVESLNMCFRTVLNDNTLKSFSSDAFANFQKNLSQPGYARSSESQEERKDLSRRWTDLLEENSDWKAAVEDLKEKFEAFENGIRQDEDLIRLSQAHAKLSKDIEHGLIASGSDKVQTGLQAVLEQATWFWQDMFKVYLPRLFSLMKDIPIPRTEYKDAELEFILENMDISSINLLPSHVYIRNITDIDINAIPSTDTSSAETETAIGTLTHIHIDAIQLKLSDLSFYFKDLTAGSMMPAPTEYTGLLSLTLPPKALSVDVKVRLIPSSPQGLAKRRTDEHYTVIEQVSVHITKDMEMEIKQSNHPLILSMFRSVMEGQIVGALERTLAEQLRGVIAGVDGVMWDLGKRREVFEDAGMGKGEAWIGAVCSEAGRFWRGNKSSRKEKVGVRATGSGIIVEQKAARNEEFGEKKGKGRGDVAFAMGAEPQILSGGKKGPMGIGCEPLAKRAERVLEGVVGEGAAAAGVATIVGSGQGVKGAVQQTKQEVEDFWRRVEWKARSEKRRDGWESPAFTFAEHT